MIISPINVNKDIPLIEQVVREAFSSTPDSNLSDWFSFPEMAESIRKDQGICLKAVDERGPIIGIIHAQQENPINGKEGTEKWVITNTAVIPPASGKGVGSKLLEAIELEAQKHGAKKIFVHTNINDKRVIHFYQKNGYQEAGSIQNYYYAGPAIFLLKFLGETHDKE